MGGRHGLVAVLLAAGVIFTPMARRTSQAQQSPPILPNPVTICVGEEILLPVLVIDFLGRPQANCPISTMVVVGPIAATMPAATDNFGFAFVPMHFTAPGTGAVALRCTSPPANPINGGTSGGTGYVMGNFLWIDPITHVVIFNTPPSDLAVMQTISVGIDTIPTLQPSEFDTRPIQFSLSGAGGFATVTSTHQVFAFVDNAIEFSVAVPGVFVLTATDACGEVKSTTFAVLGNDVSFELHDDEGALTGDPTGAVKQASGIDLSSLSFTLNGVAVPVTSTTVTVLSGPPAAPTGVRFKFTAAASLRTASGQNTLAVTALDLAGNPLDPTNTTLTYTLAPGTR